MVRVRVTGDIRPLRVGGDKRSARIEGFAPVILGALEAKPKITLAELRELLADQGAPFVRSMSWRFFARHRITPKNSAHLAEQARPNVVVRRHAWFDSQLELVPERVIFLDKTVASAKMAQLPGRVPRGQRLRAAIPQGHRKATTFVGALRFSGMTSPKVLEGTMTEGVVSGLCRAGAQSAC